MIILTLRTDKPEAEIGLYRDDQLIKSEVWTAHRQLAETLHYKIHDLLTLNQLDWSDLAGIVAYKGPGSFTGLRIGLSVVNALADSLTIPVVGITGDDWLSAGLTSLATGVNDKTVLPDYGAPVHVTSPTK